MKPYLISLVVGLLVGGIYSLLGVKSPAPPTIALIGLLGILVGEQMLPVARRLVAGQPVIAAITGACSGTVLGRLPGDPTVPLSQQDAA